MAVMHADEVRIEENLVRRLVNRQFPHWAKLPLTAAGHGTDNRMMRLGDRLVVRLPRTPDTAAAVAKEQTWLPRLGPTVATRVVRALHGVELMGARREGSLVSYRGPHTWMHADLKPSNLLVRDGRLVGVIDFGVLSVGDPTCEHAATWDLPAEARLAYADDLGLDRSTRLRAKAWALAIAVSGVPYYWSSWPHFAQECLRRLRLILRDPATSGAP